MNADARQPNFEPSETSPDETAIETGATPASEQIEYGQNLTISRRSRMLFALIASTIALLALVIAALALPDSGLATDFSARGQAPSLGHWFGTDNLGRDMLTRTVKGLARSLGIGALASVASALIALVLGIIAAAGGRSPVGRAIDAAVTFAVDACMSVPHIVLLILISFALGGGSRGVVVAVALTHWPSLTRVIRAEIVQLRESDYVQASRKLGKGPAWIARHHLLPHALPQFTVGFVLLFPHAILHEASLTFLGFGLAPHAPAIGVILAEAMRFLSLGYWWLVAIPGLGLLAVVKVISALGEGLRDLIDPTTARE
jgi:peptide/nickel transport system permease protein